MNKLTLTFIDYFPNDIEKYLNEVEGIISLTIDKTIQDIATFNFEYNSEEIKPCYILKLIELYMKPFTKPELIGFDKHYNNVHEAIYDKPNLCCEHCFLNFVLELFDNENISSFTHQTDNPNKFGYNQYKIFNVTYLSNKDKDFIDKQMSTYSFNNKNG